MFTIATFDKVQPTTYGQMWIWYTDYTPPRVPVGKLTATFTSAPPDMTFTWKRPKMTFS